MWVDPQCSDVSRMETKAAEINTITAGNRLDTHSQSRLEREYVRHGNEIRSEAHEGAERETLIRHLPCLWQ